MVEKNFEEIKKILKSEFFGIDEQIEKIVDNLKTWIEVKEHITRPQIVNVFGLTGTGKTQLVNRSIELLDLVDKKFNIKFNSKINNLDSDIIETGDANDLIFVLDEFQYFKTLDEMGSELEIKNDNAVNLIWDLLDSGILNLYGENTNYSYETTRLKSGIYSLRLLQNAGATLNDGIVYHPELYKYLKKLYIEPNTIRTIERYKLGFSDKSIRPYDETDFTDEDDDEDYIEDYGEQSPPINQQISQERNNGSLNERDSKIEIKLSTVLEISNENLYRYVKGKDCGYNFDGIIEFDDFFKNLNSLHDVRIFLEEITNSKPKPTIKNFSKSLIFVIGNLDECFTMAKQVNSDLDADYFYKQTKKVNIIDIRKALLRRFRVEQVARLGSNYVIYPSLNKEAFKQIISKEINMFNQMVLKKFNGDGSPKIKSITTKDSVHDLVYAEGVFPIIGARAIFSVISDIVFSKFSNIIKTMLTIGNDKEISIEFDYNKRNSNIILSYYQEKTLIERETIKYEVRIDKLRNESKENKGKQVHRAVHEAGHAVCSIIKSKIVPEVIYSVVMESRESGFNLFNSEDFYYHRKGDYINEIAVAMGGYCAEKLIFGEQNISSGSGSDIQQATELLSSIFKKLGLGNKVGNFTSQKLVSGLSQALDYTINDDGEFDKMILEEIERGIELSEDILKKQKLLLLKISEYLSNNPKMTNKKLIEYTKKYAIDFNVLDLKENKSKFYLDMFNNKINELENEKN